MNSQQSRRNRGISSKSILRDFLNNINDNMIYLLPYNNNAQVLAAHARNDMRVQKLTGKDLMKRNVKREANRLHIHSRYIIDLATNHIWKSCDSHQRQQFTDLANNVNNIIQNHIDNADTIDRISRMVTPQVTNNIYQDNFFNGTSFY